ncbi:unnamed protein product [Brassica oleracea var. botrytis]|uniref:(rape) hypothetical protein n=1 Tax=Brassica napus TaxID=3708 RepID=A0A816L753_BRANA|nr:unnamed protein product [Brassica napus]
MDSMQPRRETSLLRFRKKTNFSSTPLKTEAKEGESLSLFPVDLLEETARLPLSVARRRNGSLSLRGSSTNRRFSFSWWLLDDTTTDLSLGGCPRALNLSLSVGLLDGEGPLSPCGSSRIERFDDVSRWLSSTATVLSAGGSPRW